MILKNIKQGSFHGLKEKSGLYLIIASYSENFLKTTGKTKAGLLERMGMSMSNIFSVKLIKVDYYQPKIFELQLNRSSILMLVGQG